MLKRKVLNNKREDLPKGALWNEGCGCGCIHSIKVYLTGWEKGAGLPLSLVHLRFLFA